MKMKACSDEERVQHLKSALKHFKVRSDIPNVPYTGIERSV